MGNREHEKMLNKYPWMKRRARGFHRDGPPVWMKRNWAHRLRAKFRELLRRDPDQTTYPKRAGDRWEWY